MLKLANRTVLQLYKVPVQTQPFCHFTPPVGAARLKSKVNPNHYSAVKTILSLTPIVKLSCTLQYNHNCQIDDKPAYLRRMERHVKFSSPPHLHAIPKVVQSRGRIWLPLLLSIYDQIWLDRSIDCLCPTYVSSSTFFIMCSISQGVADRWKLIGDILVSFLRKKSGRIKREKKGRKKKKKKRTFE